MRWWRAGRQAGAALQAEGSMLGRGGTPSGRQAPAGLPSAWARSAAPGSAPAAPPAAGPHAGRTPPICPCSASPPAFVPSGAVWASSEQRCARFSCGAAPTSPQLRPYRHGSSPFPEPVWLRLVQRIVLQEKATSFSLPRRRMCREKNRNGPVIQTGVPVQWVRASGNRRLRAVVALGVCSSP